MEKLKQTQQTKAQKNQNEDILNGINKELREVTLFFSSNKYIDLNKLNKKDIEESAKKTIEDSIKDKFHSLTEIFSELRKTGKDLGVLNYKLMIIPLKIKIFLATFEKKDAENLLNKIDDIEKELNLTKKN